VVTALRRRGALGVKLMLSGQHDSLARDVAREVSVEPDVELHPDAAEPSPDAGSGLSASLGRLLERISRALAVERPEGVLVQGDTTTALAAALAAFHEQIPCFHVEAGLRTSNPARPFPEEMHRRLVARIATLHFAPTETARDNLLREGVPAESVLVTGNTVVDALALFGRKRAAPPAAGDKPVLLVTLHRREGAASAAAVGAAVAELAMRGDVDVVWVRHPNHTSETALAALGTAKVRVLPPQPYGAFVALMAGARIILTDSGGIQEEAPILGVPVVVLREETDRPEAVAAGNAVVVGGDPRAIVGACRELLDDAAAHARRSRVASPFGDGTAGDRIARALEEYYTRRD
jgi:UDP-N-acetylglucosamine 2-epimerase (non-hydrolysing)